MICFTSFIEIMDQISLIFQIISVSPRVQEAHFESFDTLSPSPVLHSHHPLQLFQNPEGLFDLKEASSILIG